MQPRNTGHVTDFSSKVAVVWVVTNISYINPPSGIRCYIAIVKQSLDVKCMKIRGEQLYIALIYATVWCRDSICSSDRSMSSSMKEEMLDGCLSWPHSYVCVEQTVLSMLCMLSLRHDCYVMSLPVCAFYGLSVTLE